MSGFDDTDEDDCDDTRLTEEERAEAVADAEAEDFQQGESDRPEGPAPVPNARVTCPLCQCRKWVYEHPCPICNDTGKPLEGSQP